MIVPGEDEQRSLVNVVEVGLEEEGDGGRGHWIELPGVHDQWGNQVGMESEIYGLQVFDIRSWNRFE
jgi:hypothetical protein